MSTLNEDIDRLGATAMRIAEERNGLLERVRQLVVVEVAARLLLARIDNLTTDEFQRGGERTEREMLRAALEPVGQESGRERRKGKT